MASAFTKLLRVIYLACVLGAKGSDDPQPHDGLLLSGNCLLQTKVSKRDKDAHKIRTNRSSRASSAGMQWEQTVGGAPPWAWIYGVTCCAIGPISLILAMLLVPSKCETVNKAETANETTNLNAVVGGQSQNRTAYLDVWRIMCVCVVVITHAGEEFEKYVDYNMMAGQQWVLPVIMLISGTCYSRSSMTWPHYAARLLLYFSVGNLLNWAAGMMTGTVWWEEIETRGMTFQMFFVLGLAGVVTVATPLKARLKAGTEASRFLKMSTASVVYFVVLGILTLVYFQSGLPRGSEKLQLLRVCTESTVNLLLASAAMDLLAVEHHDMIGWFLLVWIYLTRICHAEPRPGHEVHLGDLFVFALFVQRVPLRGSAAVGLACAQLFFIIAFICAFLLHPGLQRRLDLDPSEFMLERIRNYSLEFLVVVAFTTVPTVGPDRTIPFPDVIQRNLLWANKWALFAYCAHFAIYRLMLGPHWSGTESTPWGVVLVLGSSCLFAISDLAQQPKEGEASKMLQTKSI
eukprot:TRINITY_DN4020_c0_g1_i3.p1 TRINITY_DN4020_c0_g1~~TRINITY_DN4020_c0_g1_i3.p1  ORF type:complete len:516 (-),score=80.76 TRINITY_DN4020_c0_g1_i3:174-1721(-)